MPEQKEVLRADPATIQRHEGEHLRGVVSFVCPACGRRETGHDKQGEQLCRCGAKVQVG